MCDFMCEHYDMSFDFTSDTPGYWDRFWENRNGLGVGSADPDMSSPMLKEYHKRAWCKELPNGQLFELEDDPCGYLRWNGMRFGSDSITTGFRYERNRTLLEQVEAGMDDYRRFVEDYIHSTYTMGGMIVFPRHRNSINQTRGVNRFICDRWDLTLECIRRYYSGEESPLSRCLEQDKGFFDLFVDFKGYVDFFCLEDCVSKDRSKVELWLDTELFIRDPLPRTVDGYISWIKSQIAFVDNRAASMRRCCSDLRSTYPVPYEIQDRLGREPLQNGIRDRRNGFVSLGHLHRPPRSGGFDGTVQLRPVLGVDPEQDVPLGDGIARPVDYLYPCSCIGRRPCGLGYRHEAWIVYEPEGPGALGVDVLDERPRDQILGDDIGIAVLNGDDLPELGERGPGGQYLLGATRSVVDACHLQEDPRELAGLVGCEAVGIRVLEYPDA